MFDIRMETVSIRYFLPFLYFVFRLMGKWFGNTEQWEQHIIPNKTKEAASGFGDSLFGLMFC